MFKSTLLFAALSVSSFAQGYFLDKEDHEFPDGTIVTIEKTGSTDGINITVEAGDQKINGLMEMNMNEVETFEVKSPEEQERILTKAIEIQKMTMGGKPANPPAKEKLFVNIPVTLKKNNETFSATVDLDRELTKEEKEELEDLKKNFELSMTGSLYGYNKRAIGETWELDKEEALKFLGTSDEIDELTASITLLSVDENIATLEVDLDAKGKIENGMDLTMKGKVTVKRDLEHFTDTEAKGDLNTTFKAAQPNMKMNGEGIIKMEETVKIQLPVAK